VRSESIPPELCGFPLPDLPLEDIDSVMEARRLFEPHVARLAAIYATPADFERMRDAVRLSQETCTKFKNKKLSDDGAQRMTIASTRFNIAVARATQNSMIVQMMEVMLRRMELVRTLAVRQLPDISQSTKTLSDSLLAIESGDPVQIDAATAARIDLLESAWEIAAGKRLRRRSILQTGSEVTGTKKPAKKAIR
jgi:GntR family transcriptional repressor for pyruvate dehydrogenase complex